MFQTPQFWYKEKTLISSLLSPFSIVYQCADGLARTFKSHQAYQSTLPVICVGNITVGGSGKTPTAIALYQAIRATRIGINPAFLTRGYGGSINGPERVMPDGAPESWGDEALILANQGTTIKSVNRAKGAQFAEAQNHDLIIMDDGAQNLSLQKDIILTVINGSDGFGNKQLLPAGPLRVPITKGLEMSDAFIIVGEDITDASALLPEDKPVFHAHMDVVQDIELNKTQPYVAFAGIARPERFRKTLEKNGFTVKQLIPYADHHHYTNTDINHLVAKAKEQSARLITTEKDFVRIAHRTNLDLIDILPVEMTFSDESAVTNFIEKTLKERADSNQ